jgi:hypothetical protein
MVFMIKPQHQKAKKMIGTYRSVLDPRCVQDDEWFEGRAPPPPDVDLDLGPSYADRDVDMQSYDACCPCNTTIKDPLVELGMKFQNRNGKDKTLTVNRAIHTVHPQEPKRQTYIESTEYSRTTNKLQRYYSGVVTHVMSTQGKRKAMTSDPVRPSFVYNTPIATAHNEITPLPSVNVNTTAAKDTSPDVLSNYPNVVQFTLDTMKSTPAGVPESNTGQSGAELAKAANTAFADSVTRFMPPKNK